MTNEWWTKWQSIIPKYTLPRHVNLFSHASQIPIFDRTRHEGSVTYGTTKGHYFW